MDKQVRIALDAMGGDNAPGVEVEAAVDAARQWGVSLLLVGDESRLRQELAKYDVSGLAIEIRHAGEVVGMQDAASDAIRKKKDSSIRVAFAAVKEGRADAVVSAGNSGATMAAGMFVLKRLKGVERPAIATIMPTLKEPVIVLDVGGNVDCRAEHLLQFGLMGSVYARSVLGKKGPRVGLLSNGEEATKGNDLTREAHALLSVAPCNYVGYVEGRNVFDGSVDVVVCDGFVGNVLLKVSEGLADAIGTMLRREIEASFLARIGYLLARPAFRAFKRRVDYAEYGGAPLIGIDGTGMICHGGSSPKAISNAIRLARDYVVKDVNAKLAQQLGEAGQGE